MNTYFEGDPDIEWFRDYCRLSEHIESVWINSSKQINLNNKVYIVSNSYYSEFQCKIKIFLEDLEQKDIVIYFEMMTKRKINHFMKTIKNDQPSFNINSLNYNFELQLKLTLSNSFFSSTQNELRKRILFFGSYFRNTNPYGVVRLSFNFIIYLHCFSL